MAGLEPIKFGEVVKSQELLLLNKESNGTVEIEDSFVDRVVVVAEDIGNIVPVFSDLFFTPWHDEGESPSP